MRLCDWLTRTPFAHRGLHDAEAGIVENSPSAFRAAVAEGFGVELDVQRTADGEAVVFHDTTLKRLTGRSESIPDLDLEALGKIHLTGGTDRIPSLEAVLDLVGGRAPLLIEIKEDAIGNHRLEEAVARALGGYSGEAAVMSFSPEMVAWFRDRHPEIIRGLVASTRYWRELGWRLSRPSVHTRLAHDLDPAFVAYDIRSLPNAFTTGWRRQGQPLLTWTVRTEDHRERARRFADNIIFERP